MRRVSFQPALAHAAVLLPMLIAGSPAASAQTLFQKVFGITPAAPSRSERPVPSLRGMQRWSPYALGMPRNYPEATSPYADTAGGSFRTLCVRTCDGYFWPLNNNSSRSRFHDEAKSCEQSCDSEARLFYLSHGSDDIESMTDLSGRAYGQLASAFAYRRTLIAGCACRPMPWNQSERARHAHYALAEQLERDRRQLNDAARNEAVVATGPAAAPPPAEENAESAVAAADTSTPDPALHSGPPIVPDVPREVFSDNTPAPRLPTPPAPVPALSRVAAAGAAAPAAIRAEGEQMEPVAGESAAAATEEVQTAAAIPAPPEVRRPRPQRAKYRSKTASANRFGGGGAKYTWPGDAPRRVR